jgi:hypothetical protein
MSSVFPSFRGLSSCMGGTSSHTGSLLRLFSSFPSFRGLWSCISGGEACSYPTSLHCHAIRMVRDEDGPDGSDNDSDCSSIEARADKHEGKPKYECGVSLLLRLYRYEMGRSPREVPRRLRTRHSQIYRQAMGIQAYQVVPLR